MIQREQLQIRTNTKKIGYKRTNSFFNKKHLISAKSKPGGSDFSPFSKQKVHLYNILSFESCKTFHAASSRMF